MIFIRFSVAGDFCNTNYSFDPEFMIGEENMVLSVLVCVPFAGQVLMLLDLLLIGGGRLSSFFRLSFFVIRGRKRMKAGPSTK